MLAAIVLLSFGLQSPTHGDATPPAAGVRAESHARRTPASIEIRLRSFPSGVASHWERPIENSSYGALEETKSDFGHALGAEIEAHWDRLALVVRHERGSHRFGEHGDADHAFTWVSFGLRTEESGSGYGFMGLALHDRSVDRNYSTVFENDNSRLEYREVFFEVFGGSKPEKKGAVVHGAVGTSIRGLPNLFRGEGKFEHFGMTLTLDAGIRLRAIPLMFVVGGELHGYQFEYGLVPDAGPSFADVFGRTEVDTSFGAVVKLAYALGAH